MRQLDRFAITHLVGGTTLRVHSYAAILVCLTACAFGQTTGGLRGQVTDPSGAAIPAATVTLIPASGKNVSVETDTAGSYQFPALIPGIYSIRATAAGFAAFAPSPRTVQPGSLLTLRIQLSLATSRQEVTVTDGGDIELDPAKNVSASVLQGEALDALSDDPDDLQNDLMSLAGPAGGPDGGQIFVDGFSNGQMPPKGSIREVRVNSNPFSAEFDKIGYGKIEILTKPGTDKLHGSDFVQVDSSALDARNPFATAKPSFLSRQYEGDVSGPLNPKASLFLDYSYRHLDDQALVNAAILDSSCVRLPVNQNWATPTTRVSISPRLDYQATANVVLQARYAFTRTANDGVGVGQFNLPVTGTNARGDNHSAQLTATWVVNPALVNDSRFQFTRTETSTSGTNDGPVINVAGAFTGGAAATHNTFTDQNVYEFQNYTTFTHGTQLIRFGARLRGTVQDTGTDQNFNGTFYFASLTAYGETIKGLAAGLSWPQILANGGGAFQYSVVTGTPLASTGVMDFEPFLQDDWRVRPNVTISMGIRYEIQNQIADKSDFTPRAGVAWGVGKQKGTQTPQFVVRAGFGTFFDRFAIAQLLNAERFNGINQRRYIIENPSFFLTDTPSIAQLAAGQPVTSYRIDPNMVAPRAYETMVAVERAWSKAVTSAVTYVVARGVHELRTRDINAPLPGTYVLGDPASGVFPMGNANPIYQYESSGLFKQTQLVGSVNIRMNPKINLIGYYMWARASTDTDGVNTFPANSFDTSNEWGRSLYEVRSRVYLTGSVELPHGIRLSPSIYYYSPMPYNITIGEDVNGDGQNSDRPSYATKNDNPAYVVQTPYGALNLRPLPGETIIPRNLGNSFDNFSINLRTSRSWGFGETPKGPGTKRYQVTLSVEARNLLNRVNSGSPVGVLTSPLFGEAQGLSPVGTGSTTQSANRRLQTQLRFSF